MEKKWFRRKEDQEYGNMLIFNWDKQKNIQNIIIKYRYYEREMLQDSVQIPQR